MGQSRLEKQISFIIEIDKIKSIIRKTKLFHTDRLENDAEHSWHLAMMIIILSEYAESEIDMLKVLKMVLIHDIVEIDAGDVIVYHKNEVARERELQAADRIFGLLPSDQKEELIGLWQEFEEKQTAEARFAAALDRLEPVMQNYMSNAFTWKKNNISYDRIISVNQHIENGSKELWKYAKKIIDECML